MRKHYIALCEELALEVLRTCHKTDCGSNISYVASNGRIIRERWIGSYLQGAVAVPPEIQLPLI
jgi:hypothetical protein